VKGGLGSTEVMEEGRREEEFLLAGITYKKNRKSSMNRVFRNNGDANTQHQHLFARSLKNVKTCTEINTPPPLQLSHLSFSLSPFSSSFFSLQFFLIKTLILPRETNF
jgi:hypothetical protein